MSKKTIRFEGWALGAPPSPPTAGRKPADAPRASVLQELDRIRRRIEQAERNVSLLLAAKALRQLADKLSFRQPPRKTYGYN